jgi:hypothetical protein
MEWESKPHAILLRKEIKEGAVGGGKPAKSAEMRG